MHHPAPPIIAVIDDDSVYQFTAVRILQATQIAHQVLQFQNGSDALSFLRNAAGGTETLPDIIFLDINMPIIDGWAFLDEFHVLKTRLGKEIRIYMVSSSIDPRDHKRAHNHPEVAAYLEKPVTMRKFSEVLLSWEKDAKK